MIDHYLEAAKKLRAARFGVAVTGAGISAESGIPTFRGTGGIWERYPADEYATIDAYYDNPDKVWAFWLELADTVGAAKPNPGHYALAELERMGCLKAVITQNVDNLHEAAGNSRVLEYHGNARWLVCPRCRHRDPFDPSQHASAPPYCFCGTPMKPDVVMFGEPIPSQVVVESQHLAESCDVLLIVGTSAQVYPAAYLPVTAKQHGAYIIEANMETTDFTTSLTDAFLDGPAGETLPRLVQRIKELDGQPS